MTIQSKGGKATSGKLTPTERSEKAKAAAEARWYPKAEYEDELRIGDLRIPCAVLEDGRRILSERGTSAAFTHIRSGGEFARKRSGEVGARLPVFLQSSVLAPFIPNDLAETLATPIKYQSKKGGKAASGIPAEALPAICEVFLAARRAEVLSPSGLRKAAAAEVLVSGFARVGIVALVDEATGYQRDRARDALAKILEAFVATELQKWVKTFPAEYYEQMYRLNEWKYDPESNKRTPYLGKLTNDVVYDRLAPGIRGELNKMVPKDATGKKKAKLFQGLSNDFGHPKLREHLASVVTIMKLSNVYDDFQEKLDTIHPRFDHESLP
jgi:hypothetical protein